MAVGGHFDIFVTGLKWVTFFRKFNLFLAGLQKEKSVLAISGQIRKVGLKETDLPLPHTIYDVLVAFTV